MKKKTIFCFESFFVISRSEKFSAPRTFGSYFYNVRRVLYNMSVKHIGVCVHGRAIASLICQGLSLKVRFFQPSSSQKLGALSIMLFKREKREIKKYWLKAASLCVFEVNILCWRSQIIQGSWNLRSQLLLQQQKLLIQY